LQFENSRLKTELSSLNAHCHWLEEELTNRSKQNTEEKTKSARLIQELRTELSEIRADYDDAISKVSMLSMQNETQKKRVEMGQKELLQKEQDHADVIHELNLEIQAERKLVVLNKENYARLEERYNDAVREIKSMKELAIAAEQDHQQEILAMKEKVESHFHTILAKTQEEQGKKIQEYQEALDSVTLEKIELEDKFMAQNSNRGAITLGEHGEALALTDGEPVTLTALYGKLGDAQDEVRKERAERRRLELYLERVHRDIEREAPRQRQERKEYELAMAQNQDLHSRLNEALEESNSARRDLQQLQRELTEITKECYELRMENKDMALQVQNLLQKSLDGEDLAVEIQSQNQKLLKEHNRMSLKISELQKRIDDDHVLQQIEELDMLRRERDKQAVLVANIVHQRDLYRALLNKNDQTLLAEYGADGTIVAAKDQIEKLTDLESKNKELEKNLTKLNTDILSMTNQKVGMDEKISRLDALCSDLSSANSKLEADLCASRAAVARSNAEAKFFKEKVERLEESLDIMRDDLGRAADDKKSLQRICDELQTMLSSSKDEQSKLESQLRATSMQLKLVEANVKSFKDEEIRLHAENNSLRSELARYISLQESMQKIENSLSMRCNDEQLRLKEENVKLNETLESERSRHIFEVEQLKNQLEDAEIRFRQAEKEKNEANAAMISSKDKLDFTNTEIKSITEKYAALQKIVSETSNAANGKVDSDKEVIEDLSHELAKVKSDLEAALKKVDDYKLMAQSSETLLKSTVDASEEFKKAALLEAEKLKGDLQLASERAILKQNILDETAKELEISRADFKQKLEDLNATILSLSAELEASRRDKDASEKQRDCALEEMHIYRNEAIAAKDNYERELALHADARKELHSIRVKLDEEIRAHVCTKDQLKDLVAQLESGRKSWEDSESILKEAQKNTEDRLVDAQKQIEILHNHIARLSQSLEKARPTTSEIEQAPSTQDELALRLEKEVFDLRQVINFQQNEKSLMEAQLESARRTAERERAAAEIAKRSLLELRNELECQQNEKNDMVVSSTLETSTSLETKLKVAEEQLVLLRESNKMLRTETENLNTVVETLKNETNVAKSALEPMNKKCMSLEVANSELEAEKASMSRELDAWRERVQGLLKKFNQVNTTVNTQVLASMSDLLYCDPTSFFYIDRSRRACHSIEED
jgi:nucleoprotein TPR